MKGCKAMKCIITSTRVIKGKKVKSYYIGSPAAMLGIPIPEFSGSKAKAVVFKTKKEALQVARTIRNAVVEPLN